MLNLSCFDLVSKNAPKAISFLTQPLGTLSLKEVDIPKMSGDSL